LLVFLIKCLAIKFINCLKIRYTQFTGKLSDIYTTDVSELKRKCNTMTDDLIKTQKCRYWER